MANEEVTPEERKIKSQQVVSGSETNGVVKYVIGPGDKPDSGDEIVLMKVQLGKDPVVLRRITQKEEGQRGVLAKFLGRR